MAMSQNGDGLDFDQKARLRQTLHDNKRAGRVWRLGKDLIARLAHLWTIRPMCDERGRFHEVARRCTVVREDAEQVAPALASLRQRVALADQRTRFIKADLARDVQRLADPRDL